MNWGKKTFSNYFYLPFFKLKKKKKEVVSTLKSGVVCLFVFCCFFEVIDSNTCTCIPLVLVALQPPQWEQDQQLATSGPSSLLTQILVSAVQ